MSFQVPVGASRLELTATVIRCGCGDPSSHAGQCPQGVEDGTEIVYWHRNPLRRALFTLTGKAT